MKSLFFSTLAYWMYRLWSLSWRKTLLFSPDVQQALDENRPIILAHWHGDELAVLHLVHNFRLATMTSTSKDGELIDFVIKKLGGATSRGSSTRGGVGALKGLVKLIRQRKVASIAVDGPRGPIYQVKPGVFELSRLANAIIVPVGVSARSSFVFKNSWNKAILPWPFQKVVMVFGPSLPALEKTQVAKDIKLAIRLREMLFDARQQAAKSIAPGHSR